MVPYHTLPYSFIQKNNKNGEHYILLAKQNIMVAIADVPDKEKESHAILLCALRL